LAQKGKTADLRLCWIFNNAHCDCKYI